MMRFDWAIWKATFPLTALQEALISSKSTFMPKLLKLERAGREIVVDEEEARTVLLPRLAETFPELMAPAAKEPLPTLAALSALPLGSVILFRGLPYRKAAQQDDDVQGSFWDGPGAFWKLGSMLDSTSTGEEVLLLWRAPAPREE